MGLKSFPVFLTNKISTDEIEDKAERFVKYVQSGILTPEEARPIIMQMEGINAEELPKIKKEDREKINKEKKKIPMKTPKEKDEEEDGKG